MGMIIMINLDIKISVIFTLTMVLSPAVGWNMNCNVNLSYNYQQIIDKYCPLPLLRLDIKKKQKLCKNSDDSCVIKITVADRNQCEVQYKPVIKPMSNNCKDLKLYRTIQHMCIYQSCGNDDYVNFKKCINSTYSCDKDRNENEAINSLYLKFIKDHCKFSTSESKYIATYQCMDSNNCRSMLSMQKNKDRDDYYINYTFNDTNSSQCVPTVSRSEEGVPTKYKFKNNTCKLYKQEITEKSNKYKFNITKCVEIEKKDKEVPTSKDKAYRIKINMLKKAVLNIRANKEEITDFVRNGSGILSKAREENRDAKEVINLLETLGEVISKKIGNPENDRIGFEVSSHGLKFGIWNVPLNNFSGYTFPEISNQSTGQQNGQPNQTISLPKNIFNFLQKRNESYSKITSILYSPLKRMTADAANRGLPIISDKIITTSITPKLSQKLEKKNGVRISFNIVASNHSLQPLCVFWKYDENGYGTWSGEGCYLVENNHEHVQCECNHLTDFSILMTVKDVVYSKGHRVALHFITTVGCIISIIFMAIMILVIVCIRNLRKVRRYLIHMNLAIALIIGNITMLTSDFAIHYKVSCIAISIIMFYFYLAAFFWMLCEGVFIWRSLVTVFTDEDRFWKYLILGWGSPIIIVAVTVSLKHKSLITDKVCWLSLEDNTIYAFIGPALFIILIDAIVMVVTLKITYKQAKKMNNIELITIARATLILLPLLGATWLFGIFALNAEAMVFKYIFALLNSLQGFFLFVFYILFSKEVRSQIRSIYKRYSAEKYNTSHAKLSNTLVQSSSRP